MRSFKNEHTQDPIPEPLIYCLKLPQMILQCSQGLKNIEQGKNHHFMSMILRLSYILQSPEGALNSTSAQRLNLRLNK